MYLSGRVWYSTCRVVSESKTSILFFINHWKFNILYLYYISRLVWCSSITFVTDEDQWPLVNINRDNYNGKLWQHSRDSTLSYLYCCFFVCWCRPYVMLSLRTLRLYFLVVSMVNYLKSLSIMTLPLLRTTRCRMLTYHFRI